MSNKQALRKFEKLVEKHGITVVQGGKHLKVLHNGRTVGTLSTSGESNALKQAIRDLDRQNLLGKDGKEARKVVF